MKSIKELREQYQVITEKEDKEQRKLTALVRAGLFDAKKLPVLKRALEKGVDKMTSAEKKILIDLLDSLMNQVISNEPVYMKVKRNVQSMDEEVIAEIAKTPVTISDVPSIVVLKRKAVRVYPGGQQVGLYYSQQLDKYVTIPFGEAGMSEEVDLEEARRRNIDVEDRLDRRAEETPYDQMTQDQKDRTKAYKVAGRSISRGDSARETIARTIMALMQGGIAKKSRLKKLKAMRASPQRKTKIANRATQIVQQRVAQATANAANAAPKHSAATSGTMQSRVRQAALKEAVLLKLMERQQLREYSASDLGSDAADVLIPGVSAYKNFKKGNYGAAALDAAIDIGSVLTAPVTGGGSFAGRAALKGALKGGTKLAAKGAAKSAAKSGVKKGTFLRNLKASRLRNARRARGRRRDLDFDYNAGGGGFGGGSSGSQNNQSSYKTPVTHSFTSQVKPNIVGPEYKQTRSAQQTRDEILQRQSNRALLQRESTQVNLDGNLVEINSSIAEKLVNVYESLNNYNKQKMVDMLLNEETQHKIAEFVRRY